MLLDIHAHLDHVQFKDDLPQVIERAKEVLIIASGITPKTNRFVLELSKKYENVKASVGLYPIEAFRAEIEKGDYPIEPEQIDVDEEIEFIKKNKDDFVAIGEIGLDYSLAPDSAKNQKQLFEKLLELAEKIKKPVIIHSRKAEQDVIDILETSKLKKTVLHCFCGKHKLVKRAQDNGWYFTIPTNVVRSQQMQFIAQVTDINRLLTETDAPYLSPYPGERNEPAFVIEVVKKIAELKKMDAKEVENNIFKNYQSLI
ncbi:TatD family hydrolase [Candidatus Woesearchaeota archaeon]|nr:TatD family hydrolase [Candidatus Woesearchaeota archaeon]